MNNFTGIGRPTRDIETRESQSGLKIARFTLAISRPGKKDEADYLPIIAFGKTAEAAEKWLKKGKRCAVEGRVQTGSYEKDGKRVYTTDIVAERIEFIDFDKEEKEPQISGFAEISEEDVPF